MAISIATNVDSASALRFLDKTSRNISRSVTRLSSGLRINADADDSSGLAISEQLKSLVRGLAQAQRNGQDGISMTQVAEGALGEIHGALIRMRELAMQSANASQNDTTRGFIGVEYESLKSEIDRIANAADFNGIKLLSTTSGITFQVGAGANATENSITVAMLDVNTSSLGAGASTTTLSGSTVSTLGNSLEAISTIDQAITDISNARSNIGASQNRLQLALDTVSNARENLIAVNSRIRDVDVATESSDFTRTQILSQAAVSVVAQANQLPGMGLKLIG